MDHLDLASILAARVEGSNERETRDIDLCVDEYLDECYYRVDPRGVEGRRREDEMYEHEEHQARINFAGHLFTFDRGLFWTRFPDIDADLCRDFVRFGLTHPVTCQSDLQSEAQYEEAYHGIDSQAYI